MEPELQKYFEDYEDLFTTNGWKQLVEELKTAVKEVDSVTSCVSETDLFFRRGKLDILTQMASFEDAISERKRQLELDASYSSNPLEV